MENYSDNNERNVVVKLFAIIGFITTLLMGAISLFNKDYILIGTLFLSAILFASPFILKSNQQITSSVVLYTLYSLMIYLVLSGGSHGTGPIWIFIVPSVTFFIQGLKRGIVDIIIFSSAVILAFYLTKNLNIYHYQPPELPLRVIISFIVVALLSGVYEYFRDSYSKKIIALAKKNEMLATIDPLTELPNRRYTIEQIKYEKIKNQRNKNTMSLMLCDVDDFKKINDKHGHHIGDKALVHLAQIFTKSIREQDIVCRWGGEEFLFMLPNTNKENAKLLADKIHLNIHKSPLTIENKTFPITISIGVAEVVYDRNIELDIQEADNLLYHAKSTGKNKTCTNTQLDIFIDDTNT